MHPIFTRLPLVVTVHDLLMSKHRGKDATTLSPFMYYSKYLGSKLTYLNAIKRSRVDYCAYKYCKKNEIIEAYSVNSDKIKVIYEGLDDTYNADGNKKSVLDKYGLKENGFLLYVGNTYPHKNVNRVIQAVVKYNEKHSKQLKYAISSSRGRFYTETQKANRRGEIR